MLKLDKYLNKEQPECVTTSQRCKEKFLKEATKSSPTEKVRESKPHFHFSLAFSGIVFIEI